MTWIRFMYQSNHLKVVPYTLFIDFFSLNSNSIVQSGCEIFVIITNYSSKENVASKAFSSRKVVVGV